MHHTLVTFHAHPDDEALLTAGAMAKAADAGHRVVAVFATDGEAGEADRGAFGSGEALRRHRRSEAEAAAEILGVSRVVFLGFADSGSDGDVSVERHEGAFVRVPVDVAAGRLVEVLREEQADVLTTYDRHGGYGHPDHVQVHHVGARAGELAGTPAVFEATISRELLRAGLELARSMGHDLGEGFQPDSFDRWYLPESEITTVVDVAGQLGRKRAAMVAHASQSSSSTGNLRSLAVFASLPDDLFTLAFAKEWFVRRTGAVDGVDDDLFAGLA
jgi:LmbE family N-acetylglucosaminyl deacetylase